MFSFVLQHGGRVLLADEMGLGKTLQAMDTLCEFVLHLQFLTPEAIIFLLEYPICFALFVITSYK